MSQYVTYSHEKLESIIRKTAMDLMMGPAWSDKTDHLWRFGSPYFNDGVLEMAENLILALIPQEEAGEDDADD